MILFTTVDDRIDLMPFFLRHYARLGIDRFVVGVWNGTDNPSYKRLSDNLGSWTPHGTSCQMLESIRCDYDHYSGVAETPWLNRVRLEMVPKGDWYAIADLDEFYDLGDRDFPVLAASMARLGFGATAILDFVDRIAPGGLAEVPQYGDRTLDESFPYACDISAALGFGTSKIIAARQDVTIIPGHHYAFPGVNVSQSVGTVHHFKWHSGLPSMLMRRLFSYWKQQLPHAAESAKVAQLLMNPNWSKDIRLNTRMAPRIGV